MKDDRPQRVAIARHRIHEATARFNSEVRRLYPVGSTVAWRIGVCNSSVFCGTVVQHGYQDRLKVRNEATGKERWITGYNLYGVT